MSTPSHIPIEVFYSYAHEDKSLRQELEKHLSLLHRQGLISSWHDRQILPGTDWAKAINTHLETASLILLLISADFLASDYCYGIEMNRALERHQAGAARVIPILVRPVAWKGAPFEHLETLPTGGRPITMWANQDEALADIATGIRQAIEDAEMLHPNSPLPQNTAQIEREKRLRALLSDHNGFLSDRLVSFVGREKELAEMRLHIEEKIPTGGYITITGQAGQGKSSIIAKLVEGYGIENTAFHFIPLNPGPDHQVGLLRNMMARLILKYQLSEIYVASDSRPALRDYFPRVLAELAGYC